MTVPPIFNDRYPAIRLDANIDGADLVAGATYEIGLWAVRVDSDVTFVSTPAVGEMNIPESGELHLAVGKVSHELASICMYICTYTHSSVELYQSDSCISCSVRAYYMGSHNSLSDKVQLSIISHTHIHDMCSGADVCTYFPFDLLPNQETRIF